MNLLFRPAKHIYDRYLVLKQDHIGWIIKGYFFIVVLQACYDVREAPAIWQVMEMIAEDPLENDKDWEFLSTHPVHQTREAFNKKNMAT